MKKMLTLLFLISAFPMHAEFIKKWGNNQKRTMKEKERPEATMIDVDQADITWKDQPSQEEMESLQEYLRQYEEAENKR